MEVKCVWGCLCVFFKLYSTRTFPSASTLLIGIQHTCRQFTVTSFAPTAIQHVKWSTLIVLLTGELQEVQCKNTSAISLAPTIRTTWTKNLTLNIFWSTVQFQWNQFTVRSVYYPQKQTHCSWKITSLLNSYVSMLWAAQTLFTSIVSEVEAEIQVLSCNMSVFTMCVRVFYFWEGHSEKVQYNNNYILHTAL